MRATALNHVSISAVDLEQSARFYEELFGMERIPAPAFGFPVQWLRIGNLQLHIFKRETDAPPFHHIGLTIDDFDAAYRKAKELADGTWSPRLVELPCGQVQLYIRDPGGNLVELNWPDASTLDRSRYPELRRLADDVPQPPGSEQAVLYLEVATAPPGR